MNFEKLDNIQSCSLAQLFKAIINGDTRALNALHKRRLFFQDGYDRQLTIVEFIEYLVEKTREKHRLNGASDQDVEFARDLTVDKFLNLPDEHLKRRNVDCRLYYKAIIKKIYELPPMSTLKLEAKTLSLFRGLLRRNFSFSMLEAFRQKDCGFSRYNWKTCGRVLYLKMPVSLVGKDRGKWLKENTASFDIDITGPDANAKVQELIYKLFGHKKGPYPYDDKRDFLSESVPEFEEQKRLDLGEAVAQEKVVAIDSLRPAIRCLGPEQLRHLIKRIFSDIEDGVFADKKIAKDFDLSPSTFSRFAGSEWLKTASVIPDLWENTASVVMSCTAFREAAKSSGFFDVMDQK